MARTPLDQIRDLLARLTPGQKARLIVAGALTAAAVWGLVAVANRVRYETLFSNLEPEDAGLIVAKLQESKIDHRLEAGGTAVAVPAEKVAEVRLSLASEGIPRGGGVGFEIFDRSGFDVSDFVQNVNYQRAMERELGRTIEALDAVSKARVHLVLPARTLFAADGPEAKASVVVKLYRGHALRSEETLAIAHLVSSAVRGLAPEKVSIVDTDGRMLKDGQSTETVHALSARQIEIKSNVEREMQTTLVSLLEPIVGQGRVRARVDAALDFQKVERVEERYDPDGAVVRSEQKGRQKRSGGSGGGAPGTSSNLPVGTPVVSSAQTDTDESVDSVVNYEIPKTVSTITEPVGELKRLSVAVVVDNAVRRGEGEGAALQSVPRAEEEMKKITELIRAAIGIDERRGDVLTVENLPFDAGVPGDDIEAPTLSDRWDSWMRAARWPAIALGALLLFFLIVRPALRSLREAVAARPAAGEAFLLDASADTPTLVLRKKLIEISSAEPEGAARVVRAWLKEKS